MLATKEDYTTYYNKQLEKALEFQDFVADKLYNIGIPLNCYSSRKSQNKKGESRAGIEIKFDNQMEKTHNLYIEYMEKSNPNNKNYIPNGIERADNTWLYVVGNYEVIYILAKNWLQQFKNLKEVRHITTPTSKGYLFPEAMAIKYSTKIIKC